METQKTPVENSPHAQTCKVSLSSYQSDFLRRAQAPPWPPPDRRRSSCWTKTEGKSVKESREKIRLAGAEDACLLALPHDVTRRRHTGLMGSERSSEGGEGRGHRLREDFSKIKSGRSIIASPSTEPRWRSLTAPRWTGKMNQSSTLFAVCTTDSRLTI